MNHDAEIAAIRHLLGTSHAEEAFRKLYLLLAAKLLRFARAIVKEEADAEDVVAEVFKKLWEKRHTIDHVQNLRLYLYVATRNHAINRYKQLQNREHTSLEGADMMLTDHLADIVEAHDLQHRIMLALDSLPPRCKAVFIMVRYHGLRQKEVAEIMHIAPKTVENQLAIALRKLGEALPTLLQR